MIEKFIEIYSESENLIKPVLITAFILSIFLDISRIKIDPWKYLLRKLASIFNSEVLKAVDGLSERMDAMESAHYNQQKENVRRSILRFADECRCGRSHSIEMFRTVLNDISLYERLCEKTGDKNHVVKESVKLIDEIYHERLKRNDFL